MQELTKLLNIKYPIISAPMAVISGATLACAVTKAGGLGMIGGGYCDENWVYQQLELAKSGEFGIGFITWRLEQFPKALTLALSYNPRAIMLSFGSILPFVDTIKSAGVPLICQVQTLEQAEEVLEQGADVIVAQGTEAGGHGANEPLRSLLPKVIEIACDIPVLAAGGLIDGNDVREVISLGAQGVLMGTRFYASEESLGTIEQKHRIIEASDEQTVRTRVFDYARGYNWPQPYTCRALKNSFYQKWKNDADMLSKMIPSEIQSYNKAAKRNDLDIAGIFVGEGVGRIHEILPSAQIIKNICEKAGL